MNESAPVQQRRVRPGAPPIADAACGRMSPPALEVLRESLERTSCLPSGPGWELGAAAHAEIFHVLADLATDPAAADALRGAAGLTCNLMVTVGPAANGMTVTSRQRLLAHLRAGDADGAALEVESHLRALHFMWRLAGGPAAPLTGNPELCCRRAGARTGNR